MEDLGYHNFSQQKRLAVDRASRKITGNQTRDCQFKRLTTVAELSYVPQVRRLGVQTNVYVLNFNIFMQLFTFQILCVLSDNVRICVKKLRIIMHLRLKNTLTANYFLLRKLSIQFRNYNNTVSVLGHIFMVRFAAIVFIAL